MSPVELYIVAVFIVNAILGAGVFLTNQSRALNQLYLTASVAIALWLATNWLILQSSDEINVELLIKTATMIAPALPVASHLLRLAIIHPEASWSSVMWRARHLLCVTILNAVLCYSPFFISSVRMPSVDPASPLFPEPVYGWAYFVFVALFAGLIASLFIVFFGDRKKVIGLQRAELEFITMGYSAAFVIATVCGIGVTVLTKSSQTVPLANATSILAFTGIISYGIATKRILDVATIVRRFVSYILLTLYLIILYISAWSLSTLLSGCLGYHSGIISQIIPALCVAFSMAPAHGRMQKIANKLILPETLDVPAAMKQAGKVFQSVSTLNSLLSDFSSFLSESFGATRIKIFFLNSDVFREHVCDGPDSGISCSDSLITLIANTGEPILLDNLVRSRQTEAVYAAAETLKKQESVVALSILSKKRITGLVLLGEKESGRIYNKTEQEALQILCNQFAVALENAQMYTEMQDNKIRNEIMLDQLVSGVVVAGPDRRITLFNHEARRISKLAESEVIGQVIDILPPPMRWALETALETKSGLRNADATLFPREETCRHIRMGTAYLYGHDGKPMGALMVCTDITELKSLEEQVRRSDQLSSVGTLAAGMAHEIKNPLVTIKTFTQLLPTRFSDEDFRKDFSSLVAQEVARIDGIVNDLLSFSKPAKPVLVATDLREVAGQTLKLVHEQMAQRNIELKEKHRAKNTLILGDAKLLSQAIVNLNLNAIEAIEHNGTITVATANCNYRFASSDPSERAVLKPCVRLQISDTGKGIDPANLQKIFDPFFTSKSEGTGMGLSVAHGIIREHQGAIEVESEPGEGTTFSLYIPVYEGGAV